MLYDDDGIIISIIPFYADEENGYIVLKNGQYDLPYTTKLNQEQSSQFWQSFGDQAAQLLLGISEVIGGSALWLGSSAVGAGGLALALPTGGTVTIPAVAVASAGYATSGTLIAGGTITVTDAISQIAAANSNLQISFVHGPTSRRFGKNVSTRYGSDTINDIRVDAEIDSGKIQIQSGSGKKGYKINSDIPFDQITDENSVIKWIKTIPELKNITDFERSKLIRYVLQAARYLRVTGR